MQNADRQRVIEAVERLSDQAASMLDDLCEIPADGVTGEGYPETVDYIYDALACSGLHVEHATVPQQNLDDLWGADLQKSHEFLQVARHAPRTVVLAESRPGADVGVHLSNHYDLWGSVRDTRAGTVAQIIAARALHDSGVELRRGLYVSATPDGHLGGRSGAGYVAERGFGRAPVVVMGSTSGVDTITLGFKGEVWLRISVHGRSEHASRPQDGINAIEGMTHVQLALMELAAKYESQRCDHPILPDESNRPTIVMSRLRANLDSTAIPDLCQLYVDRRLNPGEDSDGAIEEIRRVVAEAVAGSSVSTEVDVIEVQEAATTPDDRPVVDIFRRNIEAVTGSHHRPAVWSHFFDFRFFRKEWGADVIAYSPGADRTRSPGAGRGAPVTDAELVQGVQVLALGLLDLLRPPSS